jgi:hypothetical protein
MANEKKKNASKSAKVNLGRQTPIPRNKTHDKQASEEKKSNKKS